MSDNFISQEELDALLGNINTSLSDIEKSMVGEVGNIILGAGATALSNILGRKVDLSTPTVEIKKLSEIRNELSGEKVVVIIHFEGVVEGLNSLLMETLTVAQLADIMMGGTGQVTDTTLDELKLSAAGEVMNQMMGSAATALSDMIKKPVNITPPEIKLADFSDPTVGVPPVAADDEDVAKVNFTLDIDDIGKADFFLTMPIIFVKKLYDMITQQNQPAPASQTTQQSQPKSQPTATATSGTTASRPVQAPPKKQEPVNVKPAKFEDFGQPQPQEQQVVLDERLQLLFDVPLAVVVELGKTKMTLKQVMELGVGSLIELDKLTGEPVDILVNNKLIARGEVVVIDENFGVRITEIVSPQERFYNINK